MADQEAGLSELQEALWNQTKLDLAKNVAAARMARGITQNQLADESGVSKATVAAIEAARAEPKLRTVIDLATALGTTHTMLLMGQEEIQAIYTIVTDPPREFAEVRISEKEAEIIRKQLASGLTTARYDAAKRGAKAASITGASAAVMVGAAIGTILIPGVGTYIGAAMASALGISILKNSKAMKSIKDAITGKEGNGTE